MIQHVEGGPLVYYAAGAPDDYVIPPEWAEPPDDDLSS